MSKFKVLAGCLIVLTIAFSLFFLLLHTPPQVHAATQGTFTLNYIQTSTPIVNPLAVTIAGFDSTSFSPPLTGCYVITFVMSDNAGTFGLVGPGNMPPYGISSCDGNGFHDFGDFGNLIPAGNNNQIRVDDSNGNTWLSQPFQFGGVDSNPLNYTYGTVPAAHPSINSIPNTTINAGDTYTATATDIDPYSVSWNGTVDYGDGSSIQSFPGMSQPDIGLNHQYTNVGTYTINISITDNQGATATATTTVTVNPNYSVSGNVFNDANHNGVKDSGESNYQGATVSLSGASSASTTTDTNGNYTFAGLASGSYTVTLTDPTGYGSTTTNPVNLTLNANTTENFGITTTSQVKLTPIVDTFVNANAPTTNYGTLDKLTVQGNPIKTAYLKYDLTSLAGKTITSVKFKITTYSDVNSVTAGPDYVYLANSPTWGETTMTYNNQPGVSSTLLGTLSNMTSLNTQYSFPLDPTGIQSAAGSRLSIGITTGTNDQLHIYSREATNVAYTPKVVIDYY